MFHAYFVDTFKINLHATKCHKSCCNASLVIAVNLKAKESFASPPCSVYNVQRNILSRYIIINHFGAADHVSFQLR
jgi:hypothetical protein